MQPRRRKATGFGLYKTDKSHRYQDGVPEGITTYYITNFPEDYGTKGLSKLFAKWGDVISVYIPKKRNKDGYLFGFAKLQRVTEPKELEKRLDQIWIGSYKLRVNIARFSSKKETVTTGNVPVHSHPRKVNRQSYAFVSKGLRFADVVKGTVSREWKVKNHAPVTQNVQDEWKGLDFVVEEEDMLWLKNSYVGYVHEPDIVHTLQDKIKDVGLLSMSVCPMGGDKVLIQTMEGEDFEELAKDAESMLKDWFIDITKWSPQEVAKQRYTWIRCQGVPLHAWKGDFFEYVVSGIGRYVSMDTMTASKRRLDIARVLIQTSSWETVNSVVKIRVNGIVFSVRPVEEPFTDPYLSSINRRFQGHVQSSSEEESGSEFSTHAASENSIATAGDFEFQNLIGWHPDLNAEDMLYDCERELRD